MRAAARVAPEERMLHRLPPSPLKRWEEAPAMLDPDPDLFWFDFPVWFITGSKTAARSPEGVSLFDPDVGLLCCKNEAGEKRVALFTDEDLAQRLLGAASIPNPSLVHIDSVEQLLNFALEARMQGYTHVQFDPEAESRMAMALVHPIDEVIDAARIKLQE
jgi:hypothetical protein